MMRSGFRIGRIFGIEIDIDWSWLLIFFLITWNLSSAFSQVHNNWSIGLQWGIAALAALLFFASVLAHELAHSLVAQAQGVPVRNITLFLFGGVSNIQRDPKSPGNEFVMAILGPLTSVVIGVVLLFVARVTAYVPQNALANPGQIAPQWGPVTTLLLWLGTINIIVGLFNLIPGFPLDGGRVLRAILWAIAGNLQRATRWAAWVGQLIAWIMIVLGISMMFGTVLPFFGTGFISGIWLVFIGWFLNNASSQSYQQIVIENILEGVPVSSMMRTDPPTVSSGQSISSLVHDHVMRSDDHAFPVLDDNRFVGLVTLDDIRGVARENWDTTTIQSIMKPAGELVTVGPDQDSAEALRMLGEHDVGQLPVLRDNQLLGLFRRRDVLRYIQFHSKELSKR